MEVPGAVTDYTVHMYSVQAQYCAGDMKDTHGTYSLAAAPAPRCSRGGGDASGRPLVAAANEHYKSMVRRSSAGLMEFLHRAGLLTKPATLIYRRANLL